MDATAHLRNAEAEPKQQEFQKESSMTIFFFSLLSERPVSHSPSFLLHIEVLFALCDNTGQRSQQQISASPQPRNSLCVTDLSAAARRGKLIS